MQFKYKRKLARFRREYRHAKQFLFTDSPEARVFRAVAILVIIWYVWQFISLFRPGQTPTDEAGALLLLSQ